MSEQTEQLIAPVVNRISRRQAIRNAFLFSLGGTLIGNVVASGSGGAGTNDFFFRRPANGTLVKGKSASTDNTMLDLQENITVGQTDPTKGLLAKFRFADDQPISVRGKVGAFISRDSIVSMAPQILLEAWDDSIPNNQPKQTFYVLPIASNDLPGFVCSMWDSGGIDTGTISGLSWNWQRDLAPPGISPTDQESGTQRNTRISTQAYDAFNIDTFGRTLFIDTTNADRLTWRENTTPTNIRNALHTADLPFTYPVSFTASPAQVGLPGGLGGVSNTQTPRADHRHPFSGRFVYSATDFTPLLAGFPDNFARIKINNAWTLRRIWAYAKVGPTGGTETYGVVNAAGVLQGTAVTIPNNAGATSEAESALQVTNLTGGTLYYLAQTASTAIMASTHVEVGIEYTMNI